MKSFPVKVISLERSIDRRSEFSANHQNINFEFFAAVDGSALTQGEINDSNLFLNPLPYPTVGAYGCALSHLRLWELACELNTPLTIVEDDAILRDDFCAKSQNVASKMPSDWDIILWGWNFDSILSVRVMPNISPVVMLFNQQSMRENTELFKRQRADVHPLALDKCFGIPAYSISPSGARKFKSQCFPQKNFEVYFPFLNRKIPNTGVDIAMNRIYANTNSYVAFPPLVVTKNDWQISTIQVAK